MKKPLNQEEINNLALSEIERGEMRANLMAHMSANPLPVRSPYMSIFMLRPVAFALALLLVVGTGTTFAAEGALPGDILYPLKVNVIESVQASFARTAEEKAAFAVLLTDRRLSEAAELEIAESATVTSRDKKSRDTDSRAAERVTRAAKHAEEVIDEVSKDDPEVAIEARAQLDATLDAHEDTLVNLSASGSADATLLLEHSKKRNEQTTSSSASFPPLPLPDL